MSADATPHHYFVIVCAECGAQWLAGSEDDPCGCFGASYPRWVPVVPASALDDLRAENERLRADRDALAVIEGTIIASPALLILAANEERDVAVRERDEARDAAKRATDLAERYGEAIIAISDALPNVNKARVIIAALAVPAPKEDTDA